MHTLIRSALASAAGLTLAFLATGECPAQAPKVGIAAAKTKPREFEEFIKGLPKTDLLKLRGNTQNEAAQSLSAKIGSAEVQKEGTFRVAVERVEAMTFPEQTEGGWRVWCKNEPIKQGSVTVNTLAFIYVRKDPEGVLAKARHGQDLTVSGKVNRADITIIDSSPLLTVDIDATSLRAGRK